MTISVNSGAKAHQKINSSRRANKNDVRHSTMRLSKVASSLGKAKNGWMGAVLRRGHGGTGCSPLVERQR